MELFGRPHGQADVERLTGDLSQLADVRLSTLEDGRARGTRVVSFALADGLAFDVLPDRCMDLGGLTFRGIPFDWRSATGYTHPALFETIGDQAPGVNPWLRTYQGGLFTTCGLDTAGFASVDEGRPYPVHGRATALQARNLCYDVEWTSDGLELWAQARMRQAVLAGENLELTRRISTQLGSPVLRVHDTVQNLGARDQPHMILYHFNFGYPLVDRGSEVHGPSQPVGIDDISRAGAEEAQRIPSTSSVVPNREFEYPLDELTSDWTGLAVVNRGFRQGSGLAVSVRFRRSQLPSLFQWNYFEDRTNVLGFMICNGGIMGRAQARETGILRLLKPGESCSYDLEVEFADTPDGVNRLASVS